MGQRGWQNRDEQSWTPRTLGPGFWPPHASPAPRLEGTQPRRSQAGGHRRPRASLGAVLHLECTCLPSGRAALTCLARPRRGAPRAALHPACHQRGRVCREKRPWGLGVSRGLHGPPASRRPRELLAAAARVSCWRPPRCTPDPQGGGPWSEASVPSGGQGTRRRPGEPGHVSSGTFERKMQVGGWQFPDAKCRWGGVALWPAFEGLFPDVATGNHLVEVLVLRGRTETEKPRCLGAPAAMPGAAGEHGAPFGRGSASPPSRRAPLAEAGPPAEAGVRSGCCQRGG